MKAWLASLGLMQFQPYGNRNCRLTIMERWKPVITLRFVIASGHGNAMPIILGIVGVVNTRREQWDYFDAI